MIVQLLDELPIISLTTSDVYMFFNKRGVISIVKGSYILRLFYKHWYINIARKLVVVHTQLVRFHDMDCKILDDTDTLNKYKKNRVLPSSKDNVLVMVRTIRHLLPNYIILIRHILHISRHDVLVHCCMTMLMKEAVNIDTYLGQLLVIWSGVGYIVK